MTFALWWILAGAVMVAAALVWMFGPYGLAAAGVMFVAAGLFLARPVDRSDR